MRRASPRRLPVAVGKADGRQVVRERVDGKAPTGAEVEWRAKEPSYFFKLSDWGDKLIELYEKEDILAPKSR